MLKKMLMPATVLLMTATGAAGQECTAGFGDGIGCFEMWTACGDVRPFVSFDEDYENAIGLRAEDIENAIESRLRARFDPDIFGGVLDLLVVLYRGAVYIQLQFHKGALFTDEYGFMSNTVTTWSRRSLRAHGGQASAVMERVRSGLDEFMSHYLRVNEPACRRR